MWEWFTVVPVAALVSAGVTFLIRWLDAKRVRWLVTGRASESMPAKEDRPARVRVDLQIHNVGNGDAFDVRVRRCNGGKNRSWVTFESGKVAAGDSFEVVFDISEDTWETAWLEVMSRTNLRGRASKPRSSDRVNLRTAVGAKGRTQWHDPSGRGLDLPEGEGGRLR